MFCKTYLSDRDVKELEKAKTTPKRLFLVFFLPSANRQSNVDLISNFIVEAKKDISLEGECV